MQTLEVDFFGFKLTFPAIMPLGKYFNLFGFFVCFVCFLFYESRINVIRLPVRGKDCEKKSIHTEMKIASSDMDLQKCIRKLTCGCTLEEGESGESSP